MKVESAAIAGAFEVLVVEKYRLQNLCESLEQQLREATGRIEVLEKGLEEVEKLNVAKEAAETRSRELEREVAALRADKSNLTHQVTQLRAEVKKLTSPPVEAIGPGDP